MRIALALAVVLGMALPLRAEQPVAGDAGVKKVWVVPFTEIGTLIRR